MKKSLFYLLIIISGLFISSCEDSSTDPDPVSTGSVFISSIPSGAQIWYQNQNKGNAPDSIVSLEPGNQSFTLKLEGYRDTTITVSVSAGVQTPVVVTMTSNLVVESFEQTIFETTGTTAQQPSGLALSTGNAYGLSSADKGKIDLFYFTNSDYTVHDVRSANLASSLTRATAFLQTSDSNLNDGKDAPTKTSSWSDKIPDAVTGNYVFVYDADKHYSKLKVVEIGGGTIGNPSWVKIQWIYNKTVDDKRF